MYTLIRARHKESDLGEKVKLHKQTNLTAVSATANFPNGDFGAHLRSKSLVAF